MSSSSGGKKAALFAACAAVFAVLTAGFALLSGSLVSSGEPALEVFGDSYTSASARISPRVIDGATGLPLKGAYIVVPETGECRVTDAYGMAGPMDVPSSRDVRFDGVLEKPWGEVTVIAYLNGYAPSAVFSYAAVKDALRDGPEIVLLPGEKNGSSYIMTEPPAREWAETLIRKFDPQKGR